MNVDDIGSVNYKETQLNIIHVLRKNGSKKFNLKGIDRYITTKFYQRQEDWSKDNPFSDISHPSKECDINDFGTEFPKRKEYFDSWNGFMLLCPDVFKKSFNQDFVTRAEPL